MTKVFVMAAALIFSASMATSQTATPTTFKLSKVIAEIEAKNYVVRDVDVEGAWIEIDARNAQGAMVELIVDAENGTILREQLDD
ncbi:MAG: PepSY domain-containing protein [Paracoccaceae bacterium]